MKGNMEVEFVKGDKIEATIKAVRAEGVYIEMPGGEGEGIVSSRCWGSSKNRRDTMWALRPGDRISVVVKWYHHPTRTLNLVLPQGEYPGKGLCLDSKATSHVSVAVRSRRKPIYHSIAQGAVLLVDTANLLGVIGHDNAACNLESISQQLRELGYEVVYFIERRSLVWCVSQQGTASEAAAILTFCTDHKVAIIEGEADLAMLQVARSLGNTICCSSDRFEDYAIEYPEIVGGQRKRSFSTVHIGGKTLLMIDGVPKAIVLDSFSAEGSIWSAGAMAGACGAEVCVDGLPILQTPEFQSKSSSTRKYMSKVNAMIKRGDIVRAIQYMEELGKTDIEAYQAVEELVATEYDDVNEGEKTYRYCCLAEKRMRRRREKIRREERLCSARRRVGPFGIRLSSRRWLAARLAAINMNSEMKLDAMYSYTRRAA